jgi:hypothetical protein
LPCGSYSRDAEKTSSRKPGWSSARDYVPLIIQTALNTNHPTIKLITNNGFILVSMISPPSFPLLPLIPFRICMAACAACEVNIAAAGPKGDQPRGWSSRVERMRLASTDRFIAVMLLGEGFLLSPSGCSKQPTTRGYFLGLPPYSPLLQGRSDLGLPQLRVFTRLLRGGLLGN